MKRLDVPKRVYNAVLATWCAAVVGVVVIFGGEYVDDRKAPAVSAGPSVTGLKAELAAFRQQNIELLSIIAEIDPDHPCLKQDGMHPSVRAGK